MEIVFNIFLALLGVCCLIEVYSTYNRMSLADNYEAACVHIFLNLFGGVVALGVSCWMFYVIAGNP
jgi:hypothetical protein